MIESIEKLRELLKGCGCSDQCYSCGINYHGSIADEIEAEIAEKYMVRPCDMDGVPVKIGDELSHDGFARNFIVHSYELTDGAWSVWDVANGATHLCQSCRHVKPRTIEDVLADFASKQHGITKEENDALIAECADEIRELMEVD